MSSRDRFVTLDGMRGIAALIVAGSHVSEMLGLGFPPHADLAVDFFFVLSGFVIAHAYEQRLASSMTPLDFIRVRLIRLHPLIMLGSGITLAMLLARSMAGGGDSLFNILEAAVAAILFIPYHQLRWKAAFPLDGPAWSLFAEYAVNILFAIICVHLSPSRLWKLLLAGVAMLVVLLALNGTVGNLWRIDTVGLSLLRVVYPFFAGVLVSRLYRKRRFDFPMVSPWLTVCALVAILFAPSGSFDAAFEFAMIVFGFPLLILMSARDSLSPAGAALMLRSGALSYPIYILHFPIAGALAGLIVLLMPERWAAAGVLMILSCVLAASWLALRYFDEPVRAWLTDSYRSRRARRLPA
jgi:peptidoglycan/LPS O-acetylase OafA/YrhL